MSPSIAWDRVARADVVRAIEEYDRLGPERFFATHGFAPTTTYDLIWEERSYPPKAILGTASIGSPWPVLASSARSTS